MTAIALHDVVKTFGPVRALDGLRLTVEPGEVHGFLGPNGAGKSTAIRVLLGLLGTRREHAGAGMSMDSGAAPSGSRAAARKGTERLRRLSRRLMRVIADRFCDVLLHGLLEPERPASQGP